MFDDRSKKERENKDVADQRAAEANQASQAAEMEKLSQAQLQRAGDFRKNLPSLAERQFGLAREQGLRGLADQIQGVRAGANRRGLLYSGLRQGAEGAARAGAAGELAQARAGINQNLENQAQQFEQQAVGAGLGDLGYKTDQATTAYKQALQNRQLKQQKIRAEGEQIGNIISGATSVGTKLLS